MKYEKWVIGFTVGLFLVVVVVAVLGIIWGIVSFLTAASVEGYLMYRREKDAIGKRKGKRKRKR